MRTVSHSGMVEAANDGASERSAACWISVRPARSTTVCGWSRARWWMVLMRWAYSRRSSRAQELGAARRPRGGQLDYFQRQLMQEGRL